MNRLNYRRVFLFLWCLFIFLLSSRSDYPDLEEWYPPYMPDPGIFVHFALYSILGFLAWNCFRLEKFSFLSVKPEIAAIVFTVMYGLSDEIHQIYVPGRTFEAKDLITDAISPICAIILIRKFGERYFNTKI